MWLQLVAIALLLVIIVILLRIVALEQSRQPALSAILTILTEGASMPATITVGGNGAQAVFTEFSGPGGTGVKVAPVGAVTFASSDAAVATVDPTSGAVVAVTVGTAVISGTDAGNGLTATDTVTVLAAVAQSATLVVTANP